MFERVRAALARVASRFNAPSPTYSRIDAGELLEERAAIMEFDGRMAREEAERLARIDVADDLARNAT